MSESNIADGLGNAKALAKLVFSCKFAVPAKCENFVLTFKDIFLEETHLEALCSRLTEELLKCNLF